MPRCLLTAALLLVSATVYAQQPADSLAVRPVAVKTNVPDSAQVAVLPLRFSCICDPIAVQTITTQLLPSFTTIQPALSRVAGVQVTPYSGAPGAWSTVRIRGVANVTGNSQPLYVVDGVPAYNTDVSPEQWSMPRSSPSTSPGTNYYTPHSPTANPLLDLPVEDIALVEVVRGAAATARYGMQGSNGVILITTRRGADGRTAPQPLRVRYSGWGGVQQVRQRYALLNARQYAEMVNEAAVTYGRSPSYSPVDLGSLGETDWQGQALRTAGMQSHNLSLDGLGRRTRYYVAADYLRQTGVVQGSSLSRYHLRANLDQQLTGKLRVGLRASASQTDQRYAGTEFDGGSLVREALLNIPAVPARSALSTHNRTVVLSQLDYYAGAPRTRRLLVQGDAAYQLDSAWTLTVRAGREQTDARELTYSPSSYPATPANVAETGTATTSVQSLVGTATLGYQRTMAGRHALTANVAYLYQHAAQQLSSQTYTLYSSGYLINDKTANTAHSLAADFRYGYDGRYEALASLRADVATHLGNPTTPTGVLPGAELRWHAHREAFLAGNPRLSELTLWAGAGQTSAFFSADRTTQYDAGLRLALFDGCLRFEAVAYQRRTRQAQAALPILLPTPVGGQQFLMYPQVGLLNRGLELTIASTWRRGALAGCTELAAATNRTEVTETSFSDLYYYPDGHQTLQAGQPLARYYVYGQDGTFPAGSGYAGQRRFRTGSGLPGYGDGYYTGSRLPRYTLNLSQQLRLHRWLLDAQLDGLFGYQLLNPTLQLLDAPSGLTNSSALALDYWTPAHQQTNIPQPGSYPTPALSSLDLASGNHLRLSQLTVAYEVLRQETRRVSVWVGGQNLFVTGSYRGFDPNVSSGGAAPLQAGLDASVYPVARVWQLGVRGQF